MVSITFVLKEPTASKPTLIYLIMRYNNDRLKYSTGEKIKSEYWNKETNRARETKKFREYPEFNARLDFIQSEAKNIFRQLVNQNQGIKPGFDVLKKALDKGLRHQETTEATTLLGFMEKYVSESTQRVNPKTGKKIANGTIRSLKNTFNLLSTYNEVKRKRIDFESIDLDFYFQFSEYLTKEKLFTTNTIGKHIRNLKTFLNEATERGLNKNLAFKSKRFIASREETDSIYLNEEELKAIFKFDLSHNKRIERVRDLFIVGCYTGLRFSDFSRLDKKHVKNGMIEIKTQKTGESVVIPVHPIVREIFDKYKDENSLLPRALSNVKMNLYLKEMGEQIEILQNKVSISYTKGGMAVTEQFNKYELVSTHTARRSFATNQYRKEIPTVTIMKITGHKTEKAFLRYIKITPDEHAKILQLHWADETKMKAI